MRHLSPCAALLAVFVVAGTASAQATPTAPTNPDEQSAGDIAAARALGVEGVRAADAGDCNEAIDKLSRAEKLHHAVSTLGRLGECQVNVGKLVEGTENLQRAIRETLPPNAPDAFVNAQERARKVLADAKPKVARLKIAVAAPPGTQIVVKVDGENVPAANLNTNRMVNPGEHVVEASAPGFLKASSRVKLAEGGSDSVAFTLEADPNAPKVDANAPPSGAGGAPGSERAATPAHQPNHVPAYVAGGVGILGLAVGAGFGFAAMSAKSDLDGACNANKVCPATSNSKLDSAKTYGTLSTVGFVVGAVGAVAAVTLFFVDFGGPSSASSASAGGRLGAFVGPGSAGLRGAF